MLHLKNPNTAIFHYKANRTNNHPSEYTNNENPIAFTCLQPLLATLEQRSIPAKLRIAARKGALFGKRRGKNEGGGGSPAGAISSPRANWAVKNFPSFGGTRARSPRRGRERARRRASAGTRPQEAAGRAKRSGAPLPASKYL